MDRIRQLGLEVALHKSEAMSFYGRRNELLYESQVTVGGVHIGVHIDETPLPRQIAAKRTELWRDLMAVWKERLSQPSTGLAAIAAVRPLFEEWL